MLCRMLFMPPHEEPDHDTLAHANLSRIRIRAGDRDIPVAGAVFNTRDSELQSWVRAHQMDTDREPYTGVDRSGLAGRAHLGRHEWK